MNDHVPHLRAIPSVGPVKRDGHDGTPCGGCQRLTRVGELVTQYKVGWWHSDCARRDIESGSPRAAWIALGHDLARSPRSYNVRESRAIVGALLGMVHDPDAEFGDEESAS